MMTKNYGDVHDGDVANVFNEEAYDGYGEYCW